MRADGYERFYAEKLWRLLPEVYRAEDSPDPDVGGPLRELVNRIAGQVAIVRRDIDRTWANQFIETCDDWCIPYLGDLLATNLVASLDARGQRLDVARTISYRRRKGTVPLLEELASAITGWDAKMVEFFRRLSRTRHGLDPAPTPAANEQRERALTLLRLQGVIGTHTATPAGGCADLRATRGADLTQTAFDEWAYTADVRNGRDRTGWHASPRIGVFLYRLHSQRVERVTPVRSTTCAEQYSFDPSGRDVPLFVRGGVVHGDRWVSPAEHQLRGPMRASLLAAALPELLDGPDPSDSSAVIERSLALFRRSGSALDRIAAHELTGDPLRFREDPNLLFVDPERGRLFAPGSPGTGDPVFRTSYHQGFSSQIGAGGYDRTSVVAEGQVPTSVAGGGGALTAALSALGVLGSEGAIQIEDSATYTEAASVTVRSVAIESDTRCRPLIRLPDSITPSALVFTGDTAGSGGKLDLSGLWITGGEIVLRGDFEHVRLRCCTLDPGEPDPSFTAYAQAIDGRPLLPCPLWIEGSVGTLRIERCVVGPIRLRGSGALDTLELEDSVVQDPLPDAPVLQVATGRVELTRCTVLGRIEVRQLDASGSILHDLAVVTDLQHGCVRFSAYAEGSALPSRYESVAIAARAPIFVSRRFSQPAYAQLLPTADRALLGAASSGTGARTLSEGGPDGAEMGAFAREQNAIKARSLLIKYAEYMPVGLSPVLVYVT